MSFLRRYPVSIVVLATAIALLLAAPAAAEVRTGVATGTSGNAEPGEADIIEATASYDTVTGSVTLAGTTREAPGVNPKLVLVGALGTAGATCALPGVTVLWDYASHEAEWTQAEPEGEPTPAEEAAFSQTGDTTTLSVASGRLVNRGFDCAEVLVLEKVEGEGAGELPHVVDGLRFPISGLEAPPTGLSPSPPPTTTAKPAAVPAPAPAALFIHRLRARRLRTGARRWARVRVRVSDPGGTATGPVRLRLRAPVGVMVRPRSRTVRPGVLQPGQARTASFHLKLTAKAKRRSRLSLIGTAPGLTARRWLVVRALGR